MCLALAACKKPANKMPGASVKNNTAEETCCACIYQEGSPKSGGNCIDRTNQETCAVQNGPCAWDASTSSCYAIWQGDCFAKPYDDFREQSQCTRSNVLNSNEIDDWLKTPGECRNIRLFYSGHGKGYATSLPGPVSECCPGGDNSVTCTGCNGLSSRADSTALRQQLCDQLKKSGGGSITVTGQQTEVFVHEELTSKIITVAYSAPDEDCKITVDYRPCGEARSECSDREARGQAYYLCKSANGVSRKTCSCWPGGFYCSFQ